MKVLSQEEIRNMGYEGDDYRKNSDIKDSMDRLEIGSGLHIKNSEWKYQMSQQAIVTSVNRTMRLTKNPKRFVARKIEAREAYLIIRTK